MEYDELLLKEFEYALERHSMWRDAEDKMVKIFSVIILGIFTFIVKGDLPKIAYLANVIILMLAFICVFIVSFRKRCAARVLHISETKLSQHAKEKYPTKQTVFNVISRDIQLRGSVEISLSRLARIIGYLFLMAIYFFFLHSGLIALRTPNYIYILGMILGTLILILTVIVNYIQNKNFKTKFKALNDSRDNQIC
jgi:putative flippase GtrA